MPHLLNFLTQNGTLFTNDHTILISHTAGGILSSLTGLYPDRQGQTVSNSYDYYPAADTLDASTFALKGSDTDYTNFTTAMSTLEPNREALATTIRDALNDATFGSGTITDAQPQTWIDQAKGYIQQAANLPH
jgi:hypothetical protein